MSTDEWPFKIAELPTKTYLVGGWVRDRLLGISSPHLDLDFVLPENAVSTAKSIAKRHQSGFVLLDAERQIARVVFANATADFAQQVGNSLNADLQRRDFCMNAIALDCNALDDFGSNFEVIPSSALIDPLNGRADLRNKLVRMVSPENLKDDPLRILRAYRQAAKLGFTIEPLTHEALRGFGKYLKQVAAERVRTELMYLLAYPQGSVWLETAIADQVLNDWLPTASLDLRRFSQIDFAITQITQAHPQLENYFAQKITGDRTVLTTLKLTALNQSATALECLELSRAEQRWVMLLLRYLPQLQNYLSDPASAKRSKQYQLFQQTGEIFPALATLAIANQSCLNQISPWLNRWLDPDDAIAHPVNLITGDDLKSECNLNSGRQIGELLMAVKLAQVEGLIKTRQEAIVYALAKIREA